MKRLLCAAAIAAVSFPVFSADVGVSVTVGQPGFYGRIDLGNVPQPPQLIYPQPVLIQRVPVGVVAPPPLSTCAFLQGMRRTGARTAASTMPVTAKSISFRSSGTTMSTFPTTATMVPTMTGPVAMAVMATTGISVTTMASTMATGAIRASQTAAGSVGEKGNWSVRQPGTNRLERGLISLQPWAAD